MTYNLHTLAAPTRTLTQHEQQLVLRTTGEHVAGWRDHMLFALALGTALREHELVALNVGDVVTNEGRAKRVVKLRVFKRSNPDEQMQEVRVPRDLRGRLERYLEQRRGAGDVLGPDTPLFVSRRHRRLSCRQARRVFALWQARAGLERRLTFHSLRHTAVTEFQRREKDLRLTQRFSRHKSLASVQRYTHPGDEELERAVDRQRC